MSVCSVKFAGNLFIGMIKTYISPILGVYACLPKAGMTRVNFIFHEINVQNDYSPAKNKGNNIKAGVYFQNNLAAGLPVHESGRIILAFVPFPYSDSNSSVPLCSCIME
jgi:hypothetical protein